MQKNGYTTRDVSKAISGFCIILALIATLSLFSGIGKGSGGVSNSSGNVTTPGSIEPVEPVQDALSGVWVFNNEPEWIGEGITFDVNFSVNGVSYSSISFSEIREGSPLPMHTGDLMLYGDTPAYFWKSGGISKYLSGWQIDTYRGVCITSKLAEVENGEKLLAYLQANAQKQNTSATELITFTIEETPYQAWAGMTWREWCDSDFDFNDIYSEELLKIIENGDINHAVSTNGVLADILPSMEITANGEYKLTGYPDELPVWNGTDLTGTTWYVPSGWLATAGYGKFNVNCNTADSSGEEFYIGYYDAEGMGVAEPTANRVGIFISGFPVYTPSNTKDFTITFTGGTDATNASLIAWLKQYGQLTSHQMPTPTLITFTIDGKTYQAEEGMTWGAWCESGYNTDGYYATAGETILTASGDIVKNASNVEVWALEEIVNGEYKLTGYPDELPIWNGTDLTGTTWYIPEGWSATSGYGLYTNTKGDCYRDGAFFSSLSGVYGWGIGYEFDPSGGLAPAANTIGLDWNDIKNTYTVSDFTLEFRGGTDMTNTSLISWLKQYGQLTSHTMPTSTIISFTVEGTTYQAEEGMTWQQWVDSDYNTKGAYMLSTSSGNAVFWESINGIDFYAVANGDTQVTTDDVITQDYAYTTVRVRHGGGAV